jgi:hypothetical protein
VNGHSRLTQISMIDLGKNPHLLCAERTRRRKELHLQIPPEMKWAANATAAPGTPSGAMFNPYVQYRVDKPLNSAVSKITAVQQDQYGNTTSLDECGWVPDSNWWKSRRPPSAWERRL